MTPTPAAKQQRKAARWIEPRVDEGAVRALASALGIGMAAARVLVHREMGDPETARRFLRPTLDDLLDPYSLADMDKAATRLKQAIDNKEKILLYGDYDVDGTCSIVILMKALELAGVQPSFHVPHRMREGYGMRSDIIDKAKQDGVSLVVSVDTGIRAGAVVAHARELGIDVIVTDHHLPEDELPPALAVLNPNRPDCPYPDKSLCGAGVAFKLVQAVLGKMGWPLEKVRRLEESFLKIVALATVADVVPLQGENRTIVKHGLAGYRDLRNIGLKALLEVAGFQEGDTPTAGQVAFRIAPRINAAGRMDDARSVIELFLTSEAAEARKIASKLHELNTERQQTEADIVQAVLEECAQSPVTDEQAALVFCGPKWHRGVLGIVASRLVERFCRPVLVLGEEDGVAQGSGRSIAPFHLLEALDAVRDVFSRYGGHRMAAGVTLDASRVEQFRERLNAFARERLTPEDFRPHVEIDAAIDFAEIREETVNEILHLAPFGAGNPAPLFLLRDVEVCGAPSVIKDKHLRVRLGNGSRTVSVKAWNFGERIEEFAPGRRVDAVITLEDDPYSAARGYDNWSVTLRDVRPAQ